MKQLLFAVLMIGSWTASASPVIPEQMVKVEFSGSPMEADQTFIIYMDGQVQMNGNLMKPLDASTRAELLNSVMALSASNIPSTEAKDCGFGMVKYSIYEPSRNAWRQIDASGVECAIPTKASISIENVLELEHFRMMVTGILNVANQ